MSYRFSGLYSRFIVSPFPGKYFCLQMLKSQPVERDLTSYELVSTTVFSQSQHSTLLVFAKLKISRFPYAAFKNSPATWIEVIEWHVLPKIRAVRQQKGLDSGDSECGRHSNGPQNAHVLILRSCECVTFPGKGELRFQVELRLLISWPENKLSWII